MNIKTEFTESECERFRRECNFSDEERAVFDLRVKARSIIEIQEALNMSESTVNRRIRNIKRKIYKVWYLSELTVPNTRPPEKSWVYVPSPRCTVPAFPVCVGAGVFCIGGTVTTGAGVCTGTVGALVGAGVGAGALVWTGACVWADGAWVCGACDGAAVGSVVCRTGSSVSSGVGSLDGSSGGSV